MKRWNKKRRKPHLYNINDYVLIHIKCRREGNIANMREAYVGPYVITDYGSNPNNYEITDYNNPSRITVVNIKYMRLYLLETGQKIENKQQSNVIDIFKRSANKKRPKSGCHARNRDHSRKFAATPPNWWTIAKSQQSSADSS